MTFAGGKSEHFGSSSLLELSSNERTFSTTPCPLLCLLCFGFGTQRNSEMEEKSKSAGASESKRSHRVQQPSPLQRQGQQPSANAEENEAAINAARAQLIVEQLRVQLEQNPANPMAKKFAAMSEEQKHEVIAQMQSQMQNPAQVKRLQMQQMQQAREQAASGVTPKAMQAREAESVANHPSRPPSKSVTDFSIDTSSKQPGSHSHAHGSHGHSHGHGHGHGQSGGLSLMALMLNDGAEVIKAARAENNRPFIPKTKVMYECPRCSNEFPTTYPVVSKPPSF